MNDEYENDINKEYIKSIFEVESHQYFSAIGANWEHPIIRDDIINYPIVHEHGQYIINTNKRTILICLNTDPSCCNHIGYFMSHDNLADFIRAELLSIEIADNQLMVKEVKRAIIGKDINLDDGDAIFINFNTNKGTLQFTGYNSQNGFYGTSYKLLEIIPMLEGTI